MVGRTIGANIRAPSAPFWLILDEDAFVTPICVTQLPQSLPARRTDVFSVGDDGMDAANDWLPRQGIDQSILLIWSHLDFFSRFQH
jgi:hypothetical protein